MIEIDRSARMEWFKSEIPESLKRIGRSMMHRKTSDSVDRGRERLLWVMSNLPESPKEREALVSASLRAKADLIVVRPEDIPRAVELGAKEIGVMSSDDSPPENVTVLTPSPSPSGSGPKQVAMMSIVGGPDQDRAIELAGVYGTLVVDCRDWQVIPLENLVAACQRTGCQLMATVTSPGEAETALGVLERGVDGVVLQPKDPEDVRRTADLVHPEMGLIDLVEAEIVGIQSAGSGDRACVDTCSILDLGEGLLIGSQADGLVLVHSDPIATEYLEARPFRVNAGAIHSYVQDLNDKTRYLSDLRSGDPSLIVGADGSTRVATIGRVKIETRPLLMIEAKSGEHSFKTILQDAETTRLVKPGCVPISVKELREGDRILAYISGKARHFGMVVEENLIER